MSSEVTLPEARAPPLAKLLVASELARRAGTVENPYSVVRVGLLGGSATLRFSADAQARYRRRSVGCAHELLRLAGDGIDFGPGPIEPATWGLSTPGSKPILELPFAGSTLRFSLQVLEGSIMSETFVHQAHFIEPCLLGRSVLDIGSNVGDTALYYAALGADVTAVEPDPENFRALTDNLALNPEVAQRVHALEMAAGTDGEVSFHSGLQTASGLWREGGTSVRVQSASLSTLVGLMRTTPDILKADCKGAEALLVSDPAVSRFRRVIIEYDSQGPSEGAISVAAKLRALGFNRLRFFRPIWGPMRLGRHGVVDAAKE